ncbi:MAG: hypothetical protein QG646_1003, partial [Euryarchaeota archaeon]|nr:hypothetical protein [Euryarchaeota archaeon]
MIEYLLRKQKITLLFFFMITITGFFSFLQLPRQEIPEVIDTSATISTSYPGASAEKVEQTVTKKIEQYIKEVQGIKNITSESLNGNSLIEVETQDGVAPKPVWDELRKKVRDAEGDLPKDANKPEINDDTNRNSFYTIHLTVENREQLYKLREIANTWRDQLRTVPGVVDVSIGGMPKQEVRIDIDTKKMHHYDVTWKKVVDALQNENEKYPIGEMTIQERICQLKLPDNYKVEDLNKVIITRSMAGAPVYLRDIGEARLTTEKIKTYVYHNQKPAIIMGICVEKG